MNKIKTEDLKVGDRFSNPVYFDDGKYLILAEGAPISKKELSVLHHWKIPFVLTNGKLIKAGVTSTIEFEDVKEFDELLN